MLFLQNAWNCLRCPGFRGLCSRAHVTVPGNTLGGMLPTHRCSVSGFGVLRKSGPCNQQGQMFPRMLLYSLCTVLGVALKL